MYPVYSELDLRWNNTVGKWILFKPLAVLHESGGILIPAGTSTDLASIPGIGRILFKTWGTWTCPAVEHDNNYSRGNISRRKADYRLLIGTKAEQYRYRLAQRKNQWPYRLASWFARWAIYSHVRMYGWLTWNRYRRNE